MKKIKEIANERKFKYILFFWSIISIQFILGSNLQNTSHIFNGFSNFFIDILRFIVMSIIFVSLHYCILELITQINIRKKEKVQELARPAGRE